MYLVQMAVEKGESILVQNDVSYYSTSLMEPFLPSVMGTHSRYSK